MKNMVQTGRCPCCHKRNPAPKEKAEALAEARAVHAKMTTRGWYVGLTHNIHWHWTLYHESRCVSISGDGWGTFYVMVNADGRYLGTGEPGWSMPLSARQTRDPNRAVRLTLRHLLPEVQNQLEKAEALLALNNLL